MPELGGTTFVGKFEFAQDPHRPASFRATSFIPGFVSNFGADGAGAFRVEIFETGNITGGPGWVCDDPANYERVVDTNDPDGLLMIGPKLGSPFNPLEEVKNGVVNPYADPARGRVIDIPSGASAELPDTNYLEVLVQLAGKDSIIGRAIVVSDIDPTVHATREPLTSANYVANDATDAEILGCCVITVAEGPAATLPPSDQVW